MEPEKTPMMIAPQPATTPYVRSQLLHTIQQEGSKAYSSRCDSNQTCDHALNCANNRRFLEEDIIKEGPHQQARSSSNVGVQYSGASIRRRRIRITSVEAVPADPEDTATNKRKKNVVGLEVLTVLLETRAYPPSCYEPGCAAGHVDNVTTGVINDTSLESPAAAPDREGP